jgi:hypothetical protein
MDNLQPPYISPSLDRERQQLGTGRNLSKQNAGINTGEVNPIKRPAKLGKIRANSEQLAVTYWCAYC